MDAERFDQVARAFSRDGSRRGVLRLLAALPLAGTLAALLGVALGAAPDEVAADGSVAGVGGHRRRKKGKAKNKKHKRVGANNHKHPGRRRKHRNKRNHHHKHKHKDKHKHKETEKPCTPAPTAQTCDGKCGEVQNNCQQPVDCGSCACDPPCPACQHCNLTSLVCEPDPEAVGNDCGQGRLCQPDGTCACSGESCGACGACGADGSCQGCATCCDGACCGERDVCHAETDQCCLPASDAETCAGQCGEVENNCGQPVDCGSCQCSPSCPVCQVCDSDTGACVPDPEQEDDPCGDGQVCRADGTCACRGNSCGNCRVCDDGECVQDTSITCPPTDQCHTEGACDPDTGECTNPRKADGTSCEADDPCTVSATCQQGVCTGSPKDCSAEDDACNVGVCNSQNGNCRKEPKQNGTGCNADNDSCTSGDSCQGGVCVAGAGVDCSTQDDQCNVGVCDSDTGQCRKDPLPDGTACEDDDACTAGDTCQAGTCEPGVPKACPVCQACSGGSCQNVSGDARCATVCCGGVCCEAAGTCDGEQCPVVCLALRENCDPSDNQCCDDASCAEANCFESGNRCCHGLQGSCSGDCDCCGEGICENATDLCCHYTQGACESVADCCQHVFNKQDCIGGRCCALPDEPCELEGDCCEGICDLENGVCVGCLGLQQSCEAAGQCCQDGGVTNCDERRIGEITCCRPSGGACSEDNDCCREGTCCNGACCPFGSTCVNNVCQDICGEHHELCSDSQLCCDGLRCRQATWPNTSTICRDATCMERLEVCDPAEVGTPPCCEASCQFRPVEQNSYCCSPEGGECRDFGSIFIGDCCAPLVCNGANICAPCRQEGETCDGADSVSNCCNNFTGDHPLLCKEGRCRVCPESGEPCVDFGDGPTCCNGLLNPCTADGICL